MGQRSKDKRFHTTRGRQCLSSLPCGSFLSDFTCQRPPVSSLLRQKAPLHFTVIPRQTARITTFQSKQGDSGIRPVPMEDKDEMAILLPAEVSLKCSDLHKQQTWESGRYVRTSLVDRVCTCSLLSNIHLSCTSHRHQFKDDSSPIRLSGIVCRKSYEL